MENLGLHCYGNHVAVALGFADNACLPHHAEQAEVALDFIVAHDSFNS